MRNFALAGAIAALFSTAASANLALTSEISCTGSLSIGASSVDSQSIACIGDLKFTGHSIISDERLTIQATNDLSFVDVSLFAPELNLIAGNQLLMDPSTELSIAAASTFINSPIVADARVALSGGVIMPSIPEPSGLVLALAGVLWLLRFKTGGKTPNPAFQRTAFGGR